MNYDLVSLMQNSIYLHYNGYNQFLCTKAITIMANNGLMVSIMFRQLLLRDLIQYVRI